MRRWRLKAVNREQLGIFMISFSKFIDSGGQLSAVVSPGSTNQSPAMVNPEGSSAPVVNIEAVTTGCQFSKQQTKSLEGSKNITLKRGSTLKSKVYF